jgi:hypothetical protein
LRDCFELETRPESDRHSSINGELLPPDLRRLVTGQMPDGLGPEGPAKALLALIVSIRVLGRGVFEKAALHTISDQTKRLIA